MRNLKKFDNFSHRNIVMRRLIALNYADPGYDFGSDPNAGGGGSEPIDWSQYDTPTDGGTVMYGPPSPVSLNSGDVSMTGNSGFMSDISNLVRSFGSAAVGIMGAVSPPKPGQLIYNPATGTYQPAGAMTSRQTASIGGTFSNPIVLIAGLALLVLLLKK